MRDEKKLNILTNKVVKLKAEIFGMQQLLTKLENKAEDLLRKLLKRNG